MALNRIAELLGIDPTDANAFATEGWSNDIFPIKIKRVAVSALSTGEKDTLVDLPTKGLVLDCFVDIKTAEATATTKTIDVGLLSSETGGDAAGFLDGAVDSAIAVVRGLLPVTDGTNTNFYAASPTLGVLFYNGLLGADAAATPGVLTTRPHILNSTAKSITYTLGSAHTELVADIYVVYVDLT